MQTSRRDSPDRNLLKLTRRDRHASCELPPAMSPITRVFLCYAAKDANDRSLLIAATKAARLPVQFVEMPNHVTDGRSRRVLCREKLQQCDVALVLASPHAVNSSAVASDLECVHE